MEKISGKTRENQLELANTWKKKRSFEGDLKVSMDNAMGELSWDSTLIQVDSVLSHLDDQISMTRQN